MSNQTWRKSSRSGAGNSCVELSVGFAGTWIRDSKHREAGELSLPAVGWSGFLAAVKMGS